MKILVFYAKYITLTSKQIYNQTHREIVVFFLQTNFFYLGLDLSILKTYKEI